VIERLSEINSGPVFFAPSNPTSRAECTGDLRERQRSRQ
jgi:hypothetical protein